ncbi:MAG: hypothetical protein M1817_003120 [Caeruleum heppii]|nr:MAG: hypothetical protein M1817_003120 [Caeruleum heppii]
MARDIIINKNYGQGPKENKSRRGGRRGQKAKAAAATRAAQVVLGSCGINKPAVRAEVANGPTVTVGGDGGEGKEGAEGGGPGGEERGEERGEKTLGPTQRPKGLAEQIRGLKEKLAALEELQALSASEVEPRP